MPRTAALPVLPVVHCTTSRRRLIDASRGSGCPTAALQPVSASCDHLCDPPRQALPELVSGAGHVVAVAAVVEQEQGDVVAGWEEPGFCPGFRGHIHIPV